VSIITRLIISIETKNVKAIFDKELTKIENDSDMSYGFLQCSLFLVKAGDSAYVKCHMSW
jgi:hypothetical protein